MMVYEHSSTSIPPVWVSHQVAKYFEHALATRSKPGIVCVFLSMTLLSYFSTSRAVVRCLFALAASKASRFCRRFFLVVVVGVDRYCCARTSGTCRTLRLGRETWG